MHRDTPTPQAIITATHVSEGVQWDDIVAHDSLSAQELATQPPAGDVLVSQLSGVRGLRARRFRGALRTAESMPLG